MDSGTQIIEWTSDGSDIGPLLLAASGRGLVSVVFHADAAVRAEALQRLASRFGELPAEAPRSARLAEPLRQLAAYFAGDLRAFELPLDWALTSGFNRQVLREPATGVPYGSVVGYGGLTQRMGQPGAAQVVGAAMGSNPLPVVVPCHRVVAIDGGLGGFGGASRRRDSCWPWRESCRSRSSDLVPTRRRRHVSQGQGHPQNGSEGMANHERKQRGGVSRAGWSRSGRLTVRYNIAPAHLDAEACARAGTGLPQEAWADFLPDVAYRKTC